MKHSPLIIEFSCLQLCLFHKHFFGVFTILSGFCLLHISLYQSLYNLLLVTLFLSLILISGDHRIILFFKPRPTNDSCFLLFLPMGREHFLILIKIIFIFHTQPQRYNFKREKLCVRFINL